MIITIEELKQLQILNRAIEDQQERLQNVRDLMYVRSPNLNGMPHGSGLHDRIGETIPAVVDLEKRISEELEELQKLKAKVETWISEQPARIRLIARLRFLDGLSWEAVTDEVFRDSPDSKTSDAVRMSFMNHLKAANRKEIEKQKRRTNTMSLYAELESALQGMTQEQRQNLADLIAGKKEEPKEPEVRKLGEPMGPDRRGPNGEELTPEQYYDYTHPIDFWGPDYYEVVQCLGKKTYIRKTPEEIQAHNDSLLKEWIEAKMKYAKKHGLSFSREYNPPRAVKRS